MFSDKYSVVIEPGAESPDSEDLLRYQTEPEKSDPCADSARFDFNYNYDLERLGVIAEANFLPLDERDSRRIYLTLKLEQDAARQLRQLLEDHQPSLGNLGAVELYQFARSQDFKIFPMSADGDRSTGCFFLLEIPAKRHTEACIERVHKIDGVIAAYRKPPDQPAA